MPIRDTPDKPFILFSGYDYYPGGGWNDYIDSFETQQEAIDKGEECITSGYEMTYGAETEKSRCVFSWYQVVDIRTMSMIVSKPEKR